MLTPRERKSPLPEKSSSEEDRTHDAASRRTASPTLYQLSYSGPGRGAEEGGKGYTVEEVEEVEDHGQSKHDAR